ncbi:MAG: hypothetical protein ABSB99_09150 [Acidimicrobiales bacterium]|jgi:hypothetical protein
MVKRGRPLENLVLTGDEGEILELWARQPQNVQALALRSRISSSTRRAERTSRWQSASS